MLSEDALGSVLIIDDDEKIRDALTRVVVRLGHEAIPAATLAEGVDRAGRGDVDVVFLDVRMPDGSGLDVISDIRRAPSSPEVIVITGWGDPDGAELAMRRGAWDYIEKPPSVRTMTDPLVRAMEYRRRDQAELGAAGAGARQFVFRGVVGTNPKREKCLRLAAKAADDDVNVLLVGPTGTGKELFARAIHDNSPRRDNVFVVVDCAALPQTIVESVLFGNEKGAYTGADRRRDGLIVQARGGTLFLDEVGELPLEAQKAFLRVLQERRVRPVGGREEIPCDFRLVAATNKSLERMAREGTFRSDLLYRLQGVGIDLPPLAGHTEDILTFAAHFMQIRLGGRGRRNKIFSEDFVEALAGYPWPGNIREIRSVMEAALALARDEEVLYPVHLPMNLRVHAARARVESGKPPGPADASPAERRREKSEGADEGLSGKLPGLKAFRDAREGDYLRELTARHGADIPTILDISGLSRSRLYALLKKHGLSIPRY